MVAVRLLLAATLAAGTAPRDDVLDAYDDAVQQVDLLELEQALQTLDHAVERAENAGLAGDPSLAALHALRAGVLLALGHGDAEVEAACRDATEIDPLIQPPIELRSAELVAICDRHRAQMPAGAMGIDHRPPEVSAADDIELVVTARVSVPDDGQLVLYWRKAGASTYVAVDMVRRGNFGRAVVPAAEHGGSDLEYFVYAFDGDAQPLANAGDREQPLQLRFLGAVPQLRPGPDDVVDAGEATASRAAPGAQLPRVILSLGLGTGVGVARGSAEQTYTQFQLNPYTAYTDREHACALARWSAGGAPLPGDPAAFVQAMQSVQGMVPGAVPQDIEGLSTAYDARTCAQHHPVDTGLASAPFHIEPEVSVRVFRGLYLSAYTRLQVVTGSRVFTDDPKADLSQSFVNDVTSLDPPGTRRRPPFTWAVGIKLKYFITRKPRKVRPFLGVFAGYGAARLRVPLGFGNDRNGNSIPDDREAAAIGPLDEDALVDRDRCTPVWPHIDGCQDAAASERARTVVANTDPKDRRVDTVRLGPGVAGALVGLHYQATPHFALKAEAQIGVWFPAVSSVLADLTVGPAVTF